MNVFLFLPCCSNTLLITMALILIETGHNSRGKQTNRKVTKPTHVTTFSTQYVPWMGTLDAKINFAKEHPELSKRSLKKKWCRPKFSFTFHLLQVGLSHFCLSGSFNVICSNLLQRKRCILWTVRQTGLLLTRWFVFRSIMTVTVVWAFKRPINWLTESTQIHHKSDLVSIAAFSSDRYSFFSIHS